MLTSFLSVIDLRLVSSTLVVVDIATTVDGSGVMVPYLELSTPNLESNPRLSASRSMSAVARVANFQLFAPSFAIAEVMGIVGFCKSAEYVALEFSEVMKAFEYTLQSIRALWRWGRR